VVSAIGVPSVRRIEDDDWEGMQHAIRRISCLGPDLCISCPVQRSSCRTKHVDFE
jgi:hypothetical protein